MIHGKGKDKGLPTPDHTPDAFDGAGRMSANKPGIETSCQESFDLRCG